MPKECVIRLAQVKVTPGDPATNFNHFRLIVNETIKDKEIKILVFPELCLSGYLIGDTWEEQSFIDDCVFYGNELAKLSTENLSIIFGNVFQDCAINGFDGRPALMNGAYIATNGKFVKNTYANGSDCFYIKHLLPNYREFEEPRHFLSATDYFSLAKPKTAFSSPFAEGHILFGTIPVQGLTVGLSICEDGWNKNYPIDPISCLVKNGAEVIINLSCSPFTINKNISRDRVFSKHARENEVVICYANSVGIQNNGKTIFAFDGSSIVYNSNGEETLRCGMFCEDNLDVSIAPSLWVDDREASFRLPAVACGIADMAKKHVVANMTETEQIFNAIIYGIREYVAQCRFGRGRSIVIGSSGGIDSAVAAALYAIAIGPEALYLVNMPTEFNSETTKSLSKTLAENIGCFYVTIPIDESVELTKRQIHGIEVCAHEGERSAFQILSSRHDESIPKVSSQIIKLSSFNMENVQARDRSSRVLAAFASAVGGVFTNNGNKTESAVGYCTMYGDLAGFLAAIGDLWKTQVYELGRYINKLYNREIIPEDIFNIVPSAELSAEQCLDQGKGDPLVYWYHDRLFRAWEEAWFRKTPYEILKAYMEGSLAEFLEIPDKTDKDIISIFRTPKSFIEDLERWYSAFKGIAVAKRVQGPPVLAVSRRTFGFDYRETLGSAYFSRGYLELKSRILYM